MIIAVLVFLVLLFALGYVDINSLPLINTTLFEVFGRTVTIYDLLVFLLMVWVVDLLPRPFRELAGVVLILWLLAFFGIVAITGLSNILLLALIVGIAFYLIKGRGR
jgi:hypothetical protein